GSRPNSGDIIVNPNGAVVTVNFEDALEAVTVDLDLDDNTEQIIDKSNNTIQLDGFMTDFVGSGFDDTLLIDAALQTRTVDMGAGNDSVTIDAQGRPVSQSVDNGVTQIHVAGFNPIFVENAETISVTNEGPVGDLTFNLSSGDDDALLDLNAILATGPFAQFRLSTAGDTSPAQEFIQRENQIVINGNGGTDSITVDAFQQVARLEGNELQIRGLPAIVLNGFSQIEIVNDLFEESDDIFLFDPSTQTPTIGQSDGNILTFSQGPDWTAFAPVEFRRGDFNGDGREDVLGLNAANELIVSLGSDTGTMVAPELWGTWSPGANQNDLQVGDFNGDGLDDVAARGSDGRWRIQRSNSLAFTNINGPLWSPVGFRDGESVSGDFDGDGFDDIALRLADIGNWFVAFGTPESFRTQFVGRWNDAANWQNIHSADVNGDGEDDIIAQTEMGAWFILDLNTTTERLAIRFWGTWSAALTFEDVTVADFNGDGRDDVAAYDNRGIWWMTAGTDTEISRTQALSQWSAVADWKSTVGDVNNDGLVDIIGFQQNTGQFWSLLSQGSDRLSATDFFGQLTPIANGSLIAGLFS
ncbi:MAG: VCBS repeat-containing protein, partial [Planctomycetaceae bacterium]|nr:VCBS repeat-containing protein [Planctomycetaceae bacterium]